MTALSVRRGPELSPAIALDIEVTALSVHPIDASLNDRDVNDGK